METLEEEEEEEEQKSTTMTTVDRSAKKKNNANVSFPNEIIEDILLRLPVRSIIRFRSLSKPWLNRISNPSFIKLHFTHNTQTPTPRTSLFFVVCDRLTHQLHLLSAPNDGGHVTPIITLDDASSTEAHYFNGLVFFSGIKNRFVVNPTTHHTFKLPHTPYFTNKHTHVCYLFGFHESTNEHLVVNIRRPYVTDPFMHNTVDLIIFFMSTHSWTKTDAHLPDHCNWSNLINYNKDTVCLNSVVHLVLQTESYDILAYDLTTNKFSIIKTPQDVVPGETLTELYTRNGVTVSKGNNPRIMKIEGCIGVVCHDRVVETNEMDIWILRDYGNRVWVRETIMFPKPWIELDCPFPLDAVSMEEIMFSSSFVSTDRIRLYMYNKTGGCFKALPFTFGYPSLCAKTVELKQINSYVETMLPV